MTEQKKNIATAILLDRIVRDCYATRQSREMHPLQWSMLRSLARFEERDWTVRSLAEFLGLTHAPISRATRTLRRKSYVNLELNPDDARSRIIRISDEGRAALSRDPLLIIAEKIEKLPEALKGDFQEAVQCLTLNGAAPTRGRR